MRLRASLRAALILISVFLPNNHGSCAPTASEDADESLLSLPYIQYVETEKAPEKVGTTIYKKDKAFPGYNIYASEESKDGFVNLVDMDGALVHKWVRDPKNAPLFWIQVTPFPDGSIFLTCQRGARSISWQKVAADSHSLATYNIPKYGAHHGAYWRKEGGFLGIIRNILWIPFQNLSLRTLHDSLVHVSPDGRPLKIIPLSKLFEKDPGYLKKLQEAADYLKTSLETQTKRKGKKLSFDLFHVNNIAELEWDIPGIAKKGCWLATIKALNRIIIVDPEQEKIVWQWGENVIDWPHHATFLKGSQILLYDNGKHKKSTRVIVLDIRSNEIIWQYGQKPGQHFFSAIRGSAQRLPNGNTLIAESNRGRVFEVTEAGEIVWEWYADFYSEGPFKGKRRPIYRMERIPYDFFKNVEFNHGKI